MARKILSDRQHCDKYLMLPRRVPNDSWFGFDEFTKNSLDFLAPLVASTMSAPLDVFQPDSPTRSECELFRDEVGLEIACVNGEHIVTCVRLSHCRNALQIHGPGFSACRYSGPSGTGSSRESTQTVCTWEKGAAS